jgi:hypothetical protein
VRVAPAHGSLRYRLGMVYLKQNRAVEARRELETAVRLSNFREVVEARRALKALR